MLNRQRVILHMLRAAGRPVQRAELMKWCFLLGHETESKGGGAFYDFVPGRSGPFSFVLDREIRKLRGLGGVNEDGEQTWEFDRLPSLGIRPEKRQPFPSHGDRTALFDEYERVQTVWLRAW